MVWVVNRAGHDYSPAKKYGRLQSLTLDDVNPLQTDRLLNHLARGIGKFVDSEEDYLLISGTPMVNMLAASLWLRRFPKCRILQWNAKSREYEESTITNEQMDTLLQRHLTRG